MTKGGALPTAPPPLHPGPETRDPRPDNPLLIEEGEAGMDLTSGHPRRAVTVERGTSEENS